MTYIYLRVLAKSSQVSLHFDVVVPLIACSFYHSSHFHGSCSMRPFERTLLFDNGVKRFADRNRNREGTKTKQQSTSKPNRRGLPLTAPTSNLLSVGKTNQTIFFASGREDYRSRITASPRRRTIYQLHSRRRRRRRPTQIDLSEQPLSAYK